MLRINYYSVILLGVVMVSLARSESVDNSVNPRQPKFGFLTGSSNMISTLAQDLISRSTTSSQVLSLNLTNLVILFVLKAIIFGASNFGLGYSGHGRSADHGLSNYQINEKSNNGFLSREELLLMLSYLQAESTQKYDCFHQLVCEEPSKAKEYLLAGKIFLKGTNLFGSFMKSSKYENILSQLQEAVSYGLNGQNCAAKYQCKRQDP